MVFKKDCIHYSGRKKNCPVSQKGKTYRIINESEVEINVYEVDPCLINNSHQQKCDYLILINEKGISHAYFIELKGTGLSGGIHQISSSIDILGKHLPEYKLFGRIVGKRATPNIKSRRVKLDERLKRLGGNLIVATNVEFKEFI